MLFAEICKENGGQLICIEPEPTPEWYENMKQYNGTVKLIKTYSPWVRIEDIPQELDYLFIDGDHRTRFAICDYHFFSPFVRAGGLIAFHDTNVIDMGVDRALKIILEESNNNLELIGEAKGECGTKVFKKTELF